jgi:hypothetical protein
MPRYVAPPLTHIRRQQYRQLGRRADYALCAALILLVALGAWRSGGETLVIVALLLPAVRFSWAART